MLMYVQHVWRYVMPGWSAWTSPIGCPYGNLCSRLKLAKVQQLSLPLETKKGVDTSLNQGQGQIIKADCYHEHFHVYCVQHSQIKVMHKGLLPNPACLRYIILCSLSQKAFVLSYHVVTWPCYRWHSCEYTVDLCIHSYQMAFRTGFCARLNKLQKSTIHTLCVTYNQGRIQCNKLSTRLLHHVDYVNLSFDSCTSTGTYACIYHWMLDFILLFWFSL